MRLKHAIIRLGSVAAVALSVTFAVATGAVAQEEMPPPAPSVASLDKLVAPLYPDALIAYSVEYGSTGIMTFIVGRDGRIYEQDLGAKTDEVAAAINDYNPDASWHLVTQ